MTSLEVDPEALRGCAGRLLDLADGVRADLTATVHAAAADRFTNDGWAVTDGLATATVAADAALAALSGRARTTGDGLRAAATGYEQADDRAAGRLRW